MANVVNIGGISFTLDNVTVDFSESTKYTTIKEQTLIQELVNNHLQYTSTNTVQGEEMYREFLHNRIDLSDFTTELAKDLNQDDKRKEFETDKNRLITLMAKNKNIYNKFNSKQFYFYILLGVLLMFTIGLIFIYLQAERIGIDVAPMILIGLSSVVLILIAVLDIYVMSTNRHYENFVTSDTTSIVELETQYIEKIPTIAKLENLMKDNKGNKNKKEVIQSILKDFNNMNYVNMRRYQLTDYKINETRNKVHFIKYAFVIISIIGMLSGLYLRTMDKNVLSNYLPISSGVFTGISLILAFTFIFTFFMHKKQNMMRNKYNWNKLYWNVKATHDKEGDYIFMP